jgi:hypothetical protein
MRELHRPESVGMTGTPKRGRAPHLREPGWLPLLVEVLRGTPRLEAALCAGRPELFDAEQRDPDERRYAIDRAKAICGECPVQPKCRGFAMTHDVSGVVAGELHSAAPDEAKRKKPKRPRPKPRPRPAAVPA